jgi:hypothetical protein
MVGLNWRRYNASFLEWFGITLGPPPVGQPVEYK